MPRLRIDDIEYNSEDLSEKGKGLMRSLQFVETQINRIQQEIAVYRTTHATYLKALKAEIQSTGIEPMKATENDTKDE